MKSKFWGVRGSIPTPGRSTIDYGGNTTCIEVVADSGDVYILDAGSGIRELGFNLMALYQGKVAAKVFITHDHWDHIQGFPFFVPAWAPGCKVDVYSGDKDMHRKLNSQNKQSETSFLTLEQITKGDTAILSKDDVRSNHTKSVFEGQQDVDRGYFPVPVKFMGSQLTFHDLKEYQVVQNGLGVSYMYHSAHPGGMFSYKLEEGERKLVFAGDYEHDGSGYGQFGENDKRMIEWAKDAEIFIIDAQYTPEQYEGKAGPPRKGWGHSQIERVCELAAAANVKHLYVTHHEPTHTDATLAKMEQRAKDYMANVLKSDIPVTFAREGMEMHV
ncbi:MBL fold metallo-hydrolase [Candidatus Pacearchaeota archaeon]|nr:MBL fold metallo-hydrolase [Candidatus Pacearchaeota archaeon]